MPDLGYTEYISGVETGELGSFLEEMDENLSALAHYFPAMIARALSLQAQVREEFRKGLEDYDHEDEEYRHERDNGLDYLPGN